MAAEVRGFDARVRAMVRSGEEDGAVLGAGKVIGCCSIALGAGVGCSGVALAAGIYAIAGISAAVGTVEGVNVAVGTVCHAATFGFVNGANLKHEIVYKETKKKYCEFSPVTTVGKFSKLKPINILKMK